jgi:hypothetical protein
VEEVVGTTVDVDEGISDEVEEADEDDVVARSTFGPICETVMVWVMVLVCVQVVVSVV